MYRRPADICVPASHDSHISKYAEPRCSSADTPYGPFPMRLQTLLLSTLCLINCVSAAEAQSGWQAGAAKQVITPPEPMWMSGYASRTHEATGTAHDLWAKALVLQDPTGKRSVLITLDLSGIGRDTSVDVCTKLKKTHGLERSQIAISTSHTHSGPVVRSLTRSMYSLDSKQTALSIATATCWWREF